MRPPPLARIFCPVFTFALGACAVSDGGGTWRSWHYDVVVGANEQELTIEAQLGDRPTARLVVAAGADPYVRDVVVRTASGWRAVPSVDGAFQLPATGMSHPVTVRYRFLLDGAVREIRDRDVIRRMHGVIVCRPSLWVLRPATHDERQRLNFTVVSAADGVAFATGIQRVDATEDRGHELLARRLAWSPATLFGRLGRRDVDVPGGVVEVVWPDRDPELELDAVIAWIDASAHAVADYFDGFPVSRVLVFVYPARRGLPGYARTFGNCGAYIEAPIGVRDRPRLDRDWVMAHEMVHLGFPNVGRPHRWLEEGSATYVESVARSRAGAVSAARFWARMRHNLPTGQPRAGDRGLDRTPTWARTYWGGALFCFVADVEIRRRTTNRMGLEHALRGIVAAGGTIEDGWSIERTLAIGDAATGVPVLRELYASWREQPVEAELDEIFVKLGVDRRRRSAELDDEAPWADVRRAITARRSPPSR